MNIKQLLDEAIEKNHTDSILLLDFLLNEKEAITLDMPVLALVLYMSSHREELNGQLTEYLKARKK